MMYLVERVAARAGPSARAAQRLSKTYARSLQAILYVRRLQARPPLTLANDWGVPFAALLSRKAKRSPAVLLWVSVAVLIGRWLSLYLIAAPAVLPEPRLGVVELLLTAGLAGLCFFAAARSLAGAPLLALKDPFLAESLRHDG